MVRSTSPEFAAQARRLFCHFRPEPADGAKADLTLSFLIGTTAEGINSGSLHRCYSGCTPIGRTSSFYQLFRQLDWQLNLFVVLRVNARCILHAGAVSRDGFGVVFPGPSGNGKSVLTMSLLLQGYRYLSDELAVIDPASGELHPFPKPIGIKDISVCPDLAHRRELWWGPKPGENIDAGSCWYVDPDDIAPKSVSGPVPVRYIVFPRYDPNARPGLEELSPGQAMRGLLNNSVNFPRIRREGLHLLVKLVQEARCLSLTTNCLDQATEAINELTSR